MTNGYLTTIKLYPAVDKTGAFIKAVGEDGEIIGNDFVVAPAGVPFSLWYDELQKDLHLAIDYLVQ